MLSYRDLSGVLADPMVQTGALAVIGAVVTRVMLRNHPTRRLVGQIAFFSALTALLLYHGIVPYAAGTQDAPAFQRIFIGLAKIIWWTNAAWSLISIVRVFLTFERRPRQARLIQDLVVGVIYTGAALSVVAYVFDAPVGTLIATSGVFAIILGLALQSTLSDVFSGIALDVGRPYGIGDWLSLSDGIEGQVVETNWRATHLLNGANDLVIVPNSILAKARLINLSSPERSHGVTLSVRLLPTVRPSVIVDVMHSVLLSSTSILLTPAPTVQVMSLDANAVGLALSFRVVDISAAAKAQNEIFDLIYRHAKAAGLTLSPSLEGGGATALAPSKTDDASVAQRTTPLRLLDTVLLFASLTEDEKEALAATMTRRTYRRDEILVEQGAVLGSLMIMRSGVAAVTRRDQGVDTELRRLAPGDFFGEGGLLAGAGEPGTIRALTFVVVYEITKEGLAPLMKDRPTIAEELGLLLSRRTAAQTNLLEQGAKAVGVESDLGLAARIRRIFDIRHADLR